MDQPILFITDAHLDPREPERTASLLALLRAKLPPGRLVILGDLFEFWFGYSSVAFSGYWPVLCELARLREAGVEITYVVGNHDFAPGPLLEKELGIDIHLGPTELTLGGRRAYLCHGDLINRKDYGYRLLCALVRRRWAQALFRWIHPDIAWRLAMATAAASRKYVSKLKELPLDVYMEFLEDRCREGYDIVLHGHTHEPDHRVLDLPSGKLELLSPGDWIRSFTYATWDGERLELHRAEQSGS